MGCSQVSGTGSASLATIPSSGFCRLLFGESMNIRGSFSTMVVNSIISFQYKYTGGKYRKKMQYFLSIGRPTPTDNFNQNFVSYNKIGCHLKALGKVPLAV